MVNKPGRRKKEGHGQAYLAIGVVIILVAASATYAYVAGLGPFSKGQISVGTTTCLTTTESSVPGNSTARSVLYARFNTTLGSFDVELFYSLAPDTVANFVNLVNQGFYNGLVWHRIASDFVIQTGDPTTRDGGGQRDKWGEGGSCTYIPFEYAPSLHNDEYYLGMASTGAQVGGSSQFYINLANNSASLDQKYAVFGKVINGTSVVQALGNAPTETVTLVGGGSQPEPNPPVYIISIKMISGP